MILAIHTPSGLVGRSGPAWSLSDGAGNQSDPRRALFLASPTAILPSQWEHATAHGFFKHDPRYAKGGE